MTKVTEPTLPRDTGPHSPEKPCAHGRLVEHILTSKGNKTGQFICLECKAVFDDPTL